MSNPLDSQFNNFFNPELQLLADPSYFGGVGTEDASEYSGADLQGSSFMNELQYESTPASSVDDSLDLFGLAEYGYDARLDVGGDSGFYELPDDSRSIADRVQEGIFGEEGFLRDLGLGAGAVKDVAAFFKGAQRGVKKQAQGQGRGRIGPGLTTSTPRTSAAGRTSRARQATSGERAIQSAISQSNRAQSAARAIANQMARAGTVTTTNDLADMISGATSPKGTKQALPGTRLRQLAIPRTA